MEVLIDPNEFQIAQDIGFASFNRINTQILWVALAILVSTIVFSLKYWHCFDVLALGRENAINLGIDYQKTLKSSLNSRGNFNVSVDRTCWPTYFPWVIGNECDFEFIRDYRHKVPYSCCDVNFHYYLGFWAIIGYSYFYLPHDIKHHR